MKCPKCKTELNPRTATVEAEFASHDFEKIDVKVFCTHCGACSGRQKFFNIFLQLGEMLFVED